MKHDAPFGVHEDSAMTDAELHASRRHLGVTASWLAAYLGVSARTVRSWEQGKYVIPLDTYLAMEDLNGRTDEYVKACVRSLKGQPHPTMIIYRNEAHYQAAMKPQDSLPASWHRAVAARVARQVPGLRIEYAAPTGKPTASEAEQCRCPKGMQYHAVNCAFSPGQPAASTS